jgi:hypothetical protein
MAKLIVVNSEVFSKITKGYVNYISLTTQEADFQIGETLLLSEFNQEVFGDIIYTTVSGIITSSDSKGVIEGYCLVTFTVTDEPNY